MVFEITQRSLKFTEPASFEMWSRTNHWDKLPFWKRASLSIPHFWKEFCLLHNVQQIYYNLSDDEGDCQKSFLKYFSVSLQVKCSIQENMLCAWGPLGTGNMLNWFVHALCRDVQEPGSVQVFINLIVRCSFKAYLLYKL